MISKGQLKVLNLALFFNILGMVFTPIYAQSEKDGIEVFITLEDSKDLVPDILSMPITVNVTTTKEVDAINILGSIDKSLKQLGFDYKGGNYSIYKNCSWEKDREVCSGYKGSISYVFELTDPVEQNKVFDILSDFQKKYGEKVDILVSNPQWIISKKNYQKAEDSLKIEIIDNVKDFSKKISEKLGKICSLASIEYDVNRPSYWRVEPFENSTYLKAAKTMVEAPGPKKEEKTVSVKVSVKMICK